MDVKLNIPKNRKSIIGVAVSGGSDSMALLHYLNQNKDALGYDIIAINVEHGIRGESSLKDSAFVKDYAEKNGIPFLGYSVDAPKYAKENGLGLEEAARILRYACFNDAIKTEKCNFIATAHHKSDNVETILFNLFRGASLNGMGGIEERDGFLRPFIGLSKEEINAYIDKNDIPFVQDTSNFDDKFTRNHLRINVIPEIKKAFEGFDDAIIRFAEIAKKEDRYLDSLADRALTVIGDVARIPVDTDEVLFCRAAVKALKKLGIKKDYEKVHVDAVFALTKMDNGAEITLPKGLVAVKEYGDVVIFSETTKKVTPISFSLGENLTEIGKITAEVTDKKDFTKGFFIDFDKLPLDTKVRTRKEGDEITKFGGGTKKLNDYFTDLKIPKRVRDKILLIAAGNVVYYVQGIAISDKVKVDGGTKTVVELK